MDYASLVLESIDFLVAIFSFEVDLVATYEFRISSLSGDLLDFKI